MHIDLSLNWSTVKALPVRMNPWDSHLLTLSNGTTGIIHLMAASSTTHGRWLVPSRAGA
jgi:hypothetical protein